MNMSIPDFTINSEFLNTDIIIIDLLSSNENEDQTGRKIYELLLDLNNEFHTRPKRVRRVTPASALKLHQVLAQIATDCKANALYPILDIECHGGLDGVKIGTTSEIVSWNELMAHFRSIASNSHFHFGVVMASCFGIHAISPLGLEHETAPAAFLIGPEKEIFSGPLLDELKRFYRVLYTSSSLQKAISEARSFKAFHAEKFLIECIARLIIDYKREGCYDREHRELVSRSYEAEAYMLLHGSGVQPEFKDVEDWALAAYRAAQRMPRSKRRTLI